MNGREFLHMEKKTNDTMYMILGSYLINISLHTWLELLSIIPMLLKFIHLVPDYVKFVQLIIH